MRVRQFQSLTKRKERKLKKIGLGQREEITNVSVAINKHAHACKQADSGLRAFTQRAACGGARLVIRSSLGESVKASPPGRTTMSTGLLSCLGGNIVTRLARMGQPDALSV